MTGPSNADGILAISGTQGEVYRLTGDLLSVAPTTSVTVTGPESGQYGIVVNKINRPLYGLDCTCIGNLTNSVVSSGSFPTITPNVPPSSAFGELAAGKYIFCKYIGTTPQIGDILSVGSLTGSPAAPDELNVALCVGGSENNAQSQFFVCLSNPDPTTNVLPRCHDYERRCVPATAANLVGSLVVQSTTD